MVELTKEGFDFAQLILSKFQKNKKTEEKIEPTDEKKDIQQEDIPKQDKYSIDYSKFQNVDDQEENQQKQLQQQQEEESEEQKMLKSMGCFHDRRKEREIYEKPTDEKLDNAETFKKEGNIFLNLQHFTILLLGNEGIQEKNYDKACFFYQKALLQFDYTFPDTEEQQSRFNKIKEATHSNMALAKYMKQDYNESLNHCEQTLKLNKQNLKAIYRKAIIFLDQDKYELCQEQLENLFQIETQNQAGRQLEKNLNEKIKQYKLKEKSLMKNIFQERK